MGKKKVIDERMVRDLKGRGADEIRIDADTILTPSAKDTVRQLGMRFTASADPGCAASAADAPPADQIDPELIYRVLSGMTDRGWLVFPDDKIGNARPPEASEAEGVVGLGEMKAMINGLVQAMKGE